MVNERPADRVVVITGASSGFGKGAARELAKTGASLVLAARRTTLLEDLAEECQALGGRALAVPTDVSRSADVAHLARAAIQTFGRIHVWINNAGVGALGRFERVPLPEHVQVIETDLLGTLYGSYFAYQHFVARGAGTLINVSSELGKHTVPYYASYVAAKHGVTSLSAALRQEIEQNGLSNIHVCTVLPTAHDTPFFDHAANYTGHEVEAPKPLHDPQDVVDAIVRLVRDPTDEEIVGADGVVKNLMHKLAPGLEEKLAGRMMHRTQIEKAPRAPDSPGAVRAPIPEGTEVRAGRD
jgi:short-subunit dehydrogenase